MTRFRDIESMHCTTCGVDVEPELQEVKKHVGHDVTATTDWSDWPMPVNVAEVPVPTYDERDRT